jgi:hypothetical protein
MSTMFDVYHLSQHLEAAIEAARSAELPDTHEQLLEIRKQIVAEFKATRAIKNAGGHYPDPR